MHIRPYVPADLAGLTELTIDTFGPFHQNSFRPAVGETVFAACDGDWRDGYRTELPGLHDPARDRWLAVAETGDRLAGFIAWRCDRARAFGEISHVAVAPAARRGGLGTALCEHAFAALRAESAVAVQIGTGGDEFHAAARALYQRLGCTGFPVVNYYREL
jgi:ribosomal protein S18 acetylase RimI-like enzyme